MSKRPVTTSYAPRAIGPYSQAVKVEAKQMVFCSGQIALDPATQEMVKGGIEEETRAVMNNLCAVLGAAGLGFDDVVKTTVFLVDFADFPRMNAIYGEYFRGPPPARSTVQVSALPKGGLIEIDVIAVKS